MPVPTGLLYLLGSLKEDHLLHGFHGKHSQRTLLTTAGKMGATLTERHTTHLQIVNNSNTQLLPFSHVTLMGVLTSLVWPLTSLTLLFSGQLMYHTVPDEVPTTPCTVRWEEVCIELVH